MQQRQNPVRKVINLLQSMQGKVTAEGKKEEELFDKFMCYCKTETGRLASNIEDAKSKISSLESAIQASSEKKAQTDQDLANHKSDSAEAKKAMAKATSLHEKQTADNAKETAETKANLNALRSALAALEKGSGKAFLQTRESSAIQRYVEEKAEMEDQVRQDVLAFLTSGDGQDNTGEIRGILKQMGDEMEEQLANLAKDKETADKDYDAMMSAKKKQVAALTEQIEQEMIRVGQLSVELASMENDLDDTKETLAADTKFLAELEAGCASKSKEYEHMKKMRAEELVAIADTIKLLNDDDSLELFKKTLPSAAASAAGAGSFLQIQVSAKAMKEQALHHLRKARKVHKNPGLDFIVLALSGRKVGFDKVIGMIDDMVTNLKKEQEDDDSKKQYCGSEFDAMEDKKKGLERSIADSETEVEEIDGSMSQLAEEIKALEAGIAALDQSVKEATEQRKTENAEYKELMSTNGAAKELLTMAKNRLNKFYNPKLYREAPKEALSQEDAITVGMGGTLAPTAPDGGIAGTGVEAFVQVSTRHRRVRVREPYKKKSEETSGVVSMLNLLINDVEKQMVEADVVEKDAQADYEKLMVDAAAKRAEDSKAITAKTSSRAAQEETLEVAKNKKAGSGEELAAAMKYMKSLHGECDWLLKYFSLRKEARDSEIDSLQKAKAVLSGADYSFLQVSQKTKSAKFLDSK